jgi:cellulose synthase/poly-beta-1,6-N-acetylglucosamine synthase-like glycosyltransferase
VTPPVAVVIPVWDAYVGFLGEAVASVRDQGVEAEVIVVDNASSEPVPAIEGARVVRSATRLSTGAARNLGLESVTAPLVVFLDADDLMLPGSLATLLAGLRPGDIAFAMAIVDGDTGGRHRAPRRLAYALARRPRVFALANTIWSLLPTQGATILRTADVRAAGGYGDRSQGEDWALGAALAWRGRIRLTSEPGLVYRWRFDSPGQPGAGLDLLGNARFVRERLRADAAVPSAARALLPLVAGLQWLAVAVARPLALAFRRS